MRRVFAAVLFIGDILLLVGQALPRRTAPGQYRCFQKRSTARNCETDHVSHLVPLLSVFLNGRTSSKSRALVTACNPRSKHVKPDYFSSTLKAWDLAIRRAALQSSMRDPPPQKGCEAAAAYTLRTYGASGGDARSDAATVSRLLLVVPMADLPQSQHEGYHLSAALNG